MDAFAERLGRVGAWCSGNKYLNGVKNAFQNYMPATIAGAVGILWCNVLVNATTGLGKLWSPIMALEFLNPIFSALQYATISCITIGITMLLAQEIAEANGEQGAYPAVLGFILWLCVTPTSFDPLTQAVTLANGKSALLSQFVSLPKGATVASFTGIASSYTSATGLFTGMVIAILGMEIYNLFRKMDAIKIRMPEQVPQGVARAFEVLAPTLFTAIVVGAMGLICYQATGGYLNELVYNAVQKPLTTIIGNNIIACMILYIIIMLFWLIGIHGVNMVAGVRDPIFKPLLYANVAAFAAGKSNAQIPYAINLTMLESFGQVTGSGVTIGLIAAIFLFGKREDNRTIAMISIAPGIFNINETVTFGIPLVLNPILGIPFVITPAICIFVGWLLITVGFCPKFVLEVPWTTPPLIQAFIATGGNIMGAITQAIILLLSILIYSPFFIAYEKYQNKQSQNI